MFFLNVAISFSPLGIKVGLNQWTLFCYDVRGGGEGTKWKKYVHAFFYAFMYMKHKYMFSVHESIKICFHSKKGPIMPAYM